MSCYGGRSEFGGWGWEGGATQGQPADPPLPWESYPKEAGTYGIASAGGLWGRIRGGAS